MADEEELEKPEEEGDVDLEGEEDEDLPPPGGSRKKVFIFIGAALFLVFGGLGGAWYAGALDSLVGSFSGKKITAEGEGRDGSGSGGGFFIDLPEILVNLNTSGRKNTFLKIRVSLELGDEEDQPRIENLMPRIIDNFQVYLRELRVEDLKGSAGMYRLREELLIRVSAAAAPIRIHDVLFKEMLIQ